MLPPAHPLFRSRSRSAGLGGADLVFVVGVPLDFRLNWGQAPVLADEAKIVYVDADDYRKHREPAAALYGDIAAALDARAEAARDTPRHEEWLGDLAAKESAASSTDCVIGSLFPQWRQAGRTALAHSVVDRDRSGRTLLVGR